MKFQKLFRLVIAGLLSIVLTFILGCSSSQQVAEDDTQFEDVADIDQLLGLADDQTDTQENIAEDDVLRLLGVSEASELETIQDPEPPAGQISMEQTPAQTETTPPATDQSMIEEPVQQPVTPPETSSAQQDWQSGSFEERYQEALQTYRGRGYKPAIQKFESLLAVNNQHSLSDNCQYWIGECYYGLGNYQQSVIAFEKVFTFPKSNKNDASQLKLGLCYMRLDNEAKAKSEFQKLVDNYPSSEYVSLAKRFIQRIE